MKSIQSTVRRVDIQVLRAIAVSLVVLYHAGVPSLTAGYLGVDIFLVISGYLITGLITRAVAENRFTLSGFYLSRAKRLLPAAYVVYLVTGLVALFFLSDVEFKRYLETLWGALTFTSNVTLWQSLDYFASSSKHNVLLHTWSLSLEEQFYFIFPLVILITPRRFWFSIVFLGSIASIALCFILVDRSPGATFFLLPTRAWELLLGVMIALVEPNISASYQSVIKRINWLAVATVLLIPIFGPGVVLGWSHPSIDAVLVCFATVIILLGQPNILNTGAIARLGSWLGGISYSLYLVHWPLFAFATNAYLGQRVPVDVQVFLILASIALAWVLNRTIENPFHQMSLNGREKKYFSISAIIATVAIALFPLGLNNFRSTSSDYEFLTRPNFGLNKVCNYTGGFTALPECQTGVKPDTLIWGDSFAMHSVGLLPKSLGGFIQATKSGCAPVIGVAQIVPEKGITESWARNCIAFNHEVKGFIDSSDNIDTVILASVFSQTLGGEDHGLIENGSTLTPTKLTLQFGIERLKKTVEMLVSSGRRVVIVGPTPTVGVDLAECMGRLDLDLVTLGKHASCTLSKAEAREYRHLAFKGLASLSGIPGVEVIDLFDTLCETDACTVKIGDTLIFRDAGHLSVEGSALLGEYGLISLPDQ